MMRQTGPLTDLEYQGTTYRLTVKSNRDMTFDFEKIPNLDKDLKALLHEYGGSDPMAVLTQKRGILVEKLQPGRPAHVQGGHGNL